MLKAGLRLQLRRYLIFGHWMGGKIAQPTANTIAQDHQRAVW